LLSVIERALPKNTKISRIPSDDAKVRLFWLQGDDPDRPNKQSKNLILVLPFEFIEDYSILPLAEQSILDIKIASEIVKEVSRFDKHSNHAPSQTPPSETRVFDQIRGYFVSI